MADRNLELALRIKALVEGAESVEALSDDLAALVQEAKRAEAPAGALGEQLAELSQAAQQAEAPAEALGDQLAHTAAAAKKADAGLDATAQAAAKTGAAAQAAEDPIAKLRQRLAEIAAQRNPMDEFNQGLTQTERAVQPLPGLLAQLQGVAVQLAATFLTVKEVLDLNDQMTALKRGFDVITGSSQATTQALDFVRGVADRLGVSSTDLAQSFLKITAAAKGTQLEGAASEKIFSALAGAMSTVGASAADVDSAMNAVAQMMSKGVISAEELRGQLGDVLPGAAQQAASALLATNAEFSKMLESGQVVASEFLPKFAEQLEKSMGGGQGQVESFGASWNRLKNQLADLATGPLGKGLTDFLAVLTDGLGITVRAASATSDAMGAVGRALGGLAAGEVSAALDDLGQALNDAGAKLFGYKTEAQEAAERQKQIAAEAKAATPEIDRFQAAVDRKELKELPETLQAAIAEFRKTGDAAKAAEMAVSAFMAEPAKNLDLTGVLKLATSLKAVGKEAADTGQKIPETIGAALSKLTNEQLTQLEQQARKAMAEAGNNDNAKKAFAELGLVIEGVVLARLQRLGVDGPEALNGISTAATEAIQDFTALATNAELSADTIESAFDGALQKLDNPKELEAFRQKIVELGSNGTLSGEQVERALLLIRQRLQEVSSDPAFAALKEALAGIREEAERDIAVAERQAEINRARIQAAIALAQARGDEAEAARLVAQATQEEVERAQERIDQLGEQQRLIDDHIQKLYAQANADGVYDEAERAVIEALKEKSAELGKEAAILDQRLPKLEREAQQAEVMAGPIGQLTRLYAEQTKEHERAAAASDRYYDTQLKEIAGSIQVAKAKGDEAEAARLVAKQQDVLINQAQAQAAAAQQAASDAQKTVEAYTLQAAATEGISAAEKEQIAQLQELANTKAAAAQQATDYAETLRKEKDAVESGSDAFDNAAQNAYKFSDAAGDVAKRNAEVGKSADDAADSMNDLNVAWIGFRDKTLFAFGQRSIGAFNEAVNVLKSAIDDANLAAQRLANEGIGAATSETESLIRYLMATEGYLSDAAHTAGNQLVDALAQARQEAEEMSESLKDMADDFRREILQIQGDQAALLELEHQENLQRLEELHQRAGQLGDDEYNEALRQANALHELKMRQLQEEANRGRDTTGNAVNNANTVRDAWGKAADEVERAASGLSRVGNTDLSNLYQQVNRVSDAAGGLARLL